MYTSSPDRRLFLMRHAERVDFTFGAEWIAHNFDKSENYTPKDLNMPDTLPTRADGAANYLHDSPLTKIGLFQAELVGQAFKKADLELSHVYSSPAYRCVQTCDAFLKGCQKRDELQIKIEPGLFEFLGWYSGQAPQWMSPEEIAAAGYNVDLNYVPHYSVDALTASQEERLDEFYVRSAAVTKTALHANAGANLLFVGHSATLDACSRELMGKGPRDFTDLFRVIKKTPYCGFLEVDQRGSRWVIGERPFPSVTHRHNEEFDYKIMLD